jgi:hypothetical protein
MQNGFDKDSHEADTHGEHPTEAHLIRGMLEAEGIRAR